VVLLDKKLNGLGVLDIRLLRSQLLDRKASPVPEQDLSQKPDYSKLCSENCTALHLYQQTIVLKNLAASTKKTYLNEFYQFLKTIKNTPANTLPLDRIKDYVAYCFTKLLLSANTINSRINAFHPVGLK